MGRRAPSTTPVLGEPHHTFPNGVRPATESCDDALSVSLARPLPESLWAGPGQTINLFGWVSHPTSRVAAAGLHIEGVDSPCTVRLLARSTHEHVEGTVPPPLEPSTAFAGLVAFPPGLEGRELRLMLTARLSDGSRRTAELGRVAVTGRPSGAARPAPQPTAGAAGPLVAVAMATYNPPADLFARQIESIRAQTHGNWVCLISDDGSQPEALAAMRATLGDDPRFALHLCGERVGFYRNFERALGLVPAAAEFVAMCDQDDFWHADKLATLLGEFGDPRTQLAYSDMRVVSRAGECVSATFWATRRNAWHDLGSILTGNTVTGAASMFRRELLEAVLPFPPSIGRFKVHSTYHDHWIACAALAAGSIRYVSRPLHDYVQHGANIIGHAACMPGQRRSRWRRAWGYLVLARPANLRAFARWWWEVRRGQFYIDAMRTRTFGTVLELRLGTGLRGWKRWAVTRMARLDSPLTVIWLLSRALRRGPASETMGLERALAQAAVWGRLANRVSWLRAAFIGRRASDLNAIERD